MLWAFADNLTVVSVDTLKRTIEELEYTEISETEPAEATSTEPRFEIDERRCLKSLDDGSSEHQIQVGYVSLGSSPDNDIRIDSGYVSPHHARLVSGLRSVSLQDLNSTNGIYVNSKQIRKHVLRDGDVITIGRHRFQFLQKSVEARNYRPEINEVHHEP